MLFALLVNSEILRIYKEEKIWNCYFSHKLQCWPMVWFTLLVNRAIISIHQHKIWNCCFLSIIQCSPTVCLLPLCNNNYFSLTNKGFVAVCQQCFYCRRETILYRRWPTHVAVGEQLIWASKTTKSLVRDLLKHWSNVAETHLLEPDSISN